MSRRRFISIIMVMVMVFAAVGCGSRKEEASEPEKEDTKVEAPAEDDNEQEEVVAEETDAEDGSDEVSADSSKETLSEDDVVALKNSIKDSVVNNYLVPNGIAAADFSWPQGNSDAWYYFDLLKTNYVASKFMGTELEQPNFPDGSNKQIIDATFNGITTWYESSGVDNYNYFESALHELSIEWITAIDVAAE